MRSNKRIKKFFSGLHRAKRPPDPPHPPAGYERDHRFKSLFSLLPLTVVRTKCGKAVSSSSVTVALSITTQSPADELMS